MPGRSTPAAVARLACCRLQPQQRVDQRAALVSRRGMRDEARRLVDDDDVIVAVDHVERDVLWDQRFDRDLGHIELQHLPGTHRIARADALAIAGQAAVGDEPLDVGARQAGRVGHEPVGTAAGRTLGHDDAHDLAHAAAPGS